MATKQSSSASWINWLTAWLILGLIAVITFWAILTSYYGWKIYLELFAHFQLQYFVISLFFLGILSLLRVKTPIYMGIFLCTILSLQILPWYIPANWFSAKSQADLRILITNINTQNRNYDKVLNLVRSEQPDLAIFMEVDEVWQKQLNQLNDFLPYSSGQTNPYNLGLLVYSNQAFQAVRTEFFGTEKNTSVIAQLVLKDKPFTLLATHPLPPVKPSFFHSRNRQLDLITQYLATVNQPIILAGDLNMTMWSPYYRRLSSKTNLKNTRKGFGILPTWPTKGTYKQKLKGWFWLTYLFTIPIDHCLVSNDFKTTNIHTGGKTGSDHKPLIVDLKAI